MPLLESSDITARITTFHSKVDTDFPALEHNWNYSANRGRVTFQLWGKGVNVKGGYETGLRRSVTTGTHTAGTSGFIVGEEVTFSGGGTGTVVAVVEDVSIDYRRPDEYETLDVANTETITGTDSGATATATANTTNPDARWYGWVEGTVIDEGNASATLEETFAQAKALKQAQATAINNEADDFTDQNP